MKQVITLWIAVLALCIAGFKVSAQTQGLLFGMTQNGGSSGGGVLFSYDPVSGKDTVLLNFKGATIGNYPQGNLIQAKNGLLYGLTYSGGASDSGTLFSYNIITGQDIVLLNFTDSIGTNPVGSMMQASDGKLYGVTTLGGQNNDGVLFCYNPLTAKDSILLNFNDTNGKQPIGKPVQAQNGLIYGLTNVGGSGSGGVLYRYNPVTGQDTILINFNFGIGDNPFNGPMLGNDSCIYGMSLQGGVNGNGVIFKHNPVTLQDTFITNLSTSIGNTHRGSILQASNNTFYGMQESGGGNNTGTLFSYNFTTGKDTALINFNGTTGNYPWGTPIQAANGLLYGMTFLGGTSSAGTIFSYDITTGKDTVLVNFNYTNGANPVGNLLETMSYKVTGKDTLNCFGDTNGWAKITTRGAKMPVSFLWSNSSTLDSIGGLQAGTYSCQISDSSGITFTATVTIVQPPPLVANPLVSNACAGNNGIAWIGPSGGTMPYSYLWNNGITSDTNTGLAPGNDTCAITDAHGCRDTGIATIDTATPLIIDSVVTTATTCNGCNDGTATVYVSGGTPPGDTASFSYLWNNSTVDSATIHGIPGGEVNVCVTSNYGSACGTKCDSGFVVTGIEQLNPAIRGNELRIEPNPSNGRFAVSITNYARLPLQFGQELGITNRIEIYNMLGQRVFQAQYSILNTQYKIDLSKEPAGIYLCRIIDNTGNPMAAAKFIIQR